MKIEKMLELRKNKGSLKNIPENFSFRKPLVQKIYYNAHFCILDNFKHFASTEKINYTFKKLMIS